MARPQTTDIAASACQRARATLTARAGAEEIRAEGEKAIDDGREPHRDRAKKHRHHRVSENQCRLTREENPARAVEKAEQREERNIGEPQCRGDYAHAWNSERKLVQGQRERPAPHGHGEPVRGEVAHDRQKRFAVPARDGLELDVEDAHRLFLLHGGKVACVDQSIQ